MEPTRALIAATGGNSPQMMINELAERIANGDIGTAMLVGGEGLGSIMAALGQGVDHSQSSGWNDDVDGPLEEIGGKDAVHAGRAQGHMLYYPVEYDLDI